MAGFECTVEEKNNYKKVMVQHFFFFNMLAWSRSNEFRVPDLLEASQHVIQI